MKKKRCFRIVSGMTPERFLLFISILFLPAYAGFSSGQKEAGRSEEKKTAGSETELKTDARKTAETTLRIAGLKGPSGFGMVRMFDRAPDLGGGVGTAFSAAPTPDIMIARILSGEVDIAALPTNVAAKLYNKGVPIVLGAVTGSGVLYLVTRDTSITGLQELAGRTVYNTGKGSSPQFIFEYILSKNGIVPGQDVKIDYTYAHLELAQAFIAGRAEYAVLPEPFVTKILRAVPDARVVLDFQKLWRDTVYASGSPGGAAGTDSTRNADEQKPGTAQSPDEGTDAASVTEPGAGMQESYPMTVVVIRKSVVQKYPDAVERFLSAYEASISWVRENPAAAGKLIERFEFGLTAAEAAEAIPRCNNVFIPAREAERGVLEFLSVLLEFDPDSVGNVLPDGGFFYGN